MGYEITRVNLCFGDWLFWHDQQCCNYRGTYEEWEKFISNLYEEKGITDIILVDEQRKYHKEAIAIALEENIRVIVTDFGYLRPDWIAVEYNGLNGSSLFPRDLETIMQMDKSLPEVDWQKKFSDRMVDMIGKEILYGASAALTEWQ